MCVCVCVCVRVCVCVLARVREQNSHITITLQTQSLWPYCANGRNGETETESFLRSQSMSGRLMWVGG